MPVIRDLPLSLSTSDVLRRQGLRREATVRPEIDRSIRELLASLRKSHLLEPAAAYECYAVKSMNSGQVSLDGNGAICGPLLPAVFPEAKELVVIVCTIGSRLERQVTEYSKSGEALRGLILDGIGSAAVDELVSEVLKLITAEVSRRAYEISSPVHPGMSGFPLAEQRNLLRLVKANEIGVSVTASGLLVPRKSTSMVVGIGPHMTRWTPAEVCARCTLSETCQYRVTQGDDHL